MLEDVEINNAAKEMWNADFAIIAYDRGVSESPKIQYANQVCGFLSCILANGR